MPPEGLLTVQDVAERLRVAPITVYRMVYRRELTPVRIGRMVRFQPSEIGRYVQRQSIAVPRRRARRVVG